MPWDAPSRLAMGLRMPEMLPRACSSQESAWPTTNEGRDLYFASGRSTDQALIELGALAIEPLVTPVQTPWPAAPYLQPRRLASRIFEHIEAFEAACLWHTESSELQEIMFSCGGRGAGGVWQAMPEVICDWFTSAQFRCATMLRLGTLRPCAHAMCNLIRRAAAPT